jgi:septum formation protein
VTKPALHLASSSPRRVEILKSLGLTFSAEGVDIDETPQPGEGVQELVLRLAEEKALAAAGQHDAVILGSDTVVALDGVIFGKPRGEADALDMLGKLSGRSHQVLTGVALIDGQRVFRDLSVTTVNFREIQADEALQYWQSGEPEGKAGAYAIQGLGGVFVESISGSYSGVVGLPVFQTAQLLRQAGIRVIAGEEPKDLSAV